jgi:hypothetical protein
MANPTVEDRSLSSVLTRLDRLEKIVVCMFKDENLREARSLIAAIDESVLANCVSHMTIYDGAIMEK